MTAPGALRPAWEFAATGTRWRLYHDGALPEAVAVEVIEAVAADEARWSRFRADSELSELNRHAGEWTELSTETFALLRACVEWTARTGGVFDPLTGGAVQAWGYAGSVCNGELGCERSPEAVPVAGSIELHPAGRRVRVPAGAQLDLGGIGKGWIAGRVAALIGRRAPAAGEVLVDAGGDLVAVTGTHRVAVESVRPGDPGVLGFVELRAGQAIATSGCGRRQWTNGDGRRAHHLIDPRTGEPGPRVHATVLADDPVSADVMAKVLALRPQAIADVPCAALLQLEDTIVASPAWPS
jgi:thiamine biosynthesis lipoprotein